MPADVPRQETAVSDEPTTPALDTPQADDARTDTVVAEEVLVEEVSIDGMCGVY